MLHAGAFVAGLDAGHAYNTFPLMNGHLIPPEYHCDNLPAWRNAFESTAAVQLHHRVLALSTLASVSVTWLAARGLRLPRTPRLLLNMLLGMTAVQVALGVTTLLTYVPASLGSAHQTGALTLLTLAVALMHSLRPRVRSSRTFAAAEMPAALLAISAIAIAAVQAA
jgi:heme a synthase